MWLTSVEHLVIVDAVGNASVAAALGVIALTFAAAVVGWRLKTAKLATLAAVAFCLEVLLVVSFANIPVSQLDTLDYLLVVMLPVGFAVWLMVCWSLMLVVMRLATRQRPRAADVPRRVGSVAALLSTCVGAGSLVVLSLIAQTQQSTYGAWMQTPQAMSGVQIASARIESLVRPGPVEVEVQATGGTPAYSYTAGIVWALQQAGYSPATEPFTAVVIGPVYEPGRGAPVAHVTISVSSVAVDVTRV